MKTPRLEAYCDDSLSNIGEKRLFLAGYLGASEQWEKFSADWQAALAAAPSIDYLKMSEARAMRGPFKGWNAEARDTKIKILENLIEGANLLSFEFSVSEKSFASHVKPHAPRGLGNVHFACIFGVISSVSRHLSTTGIKIPIDFFFDNQDGTDDDLELFFEYMRNDIPLPARNLIQKNPQFLDDKNAVALQACDMLAWHLRREHELGLPKFKLSGCLANPHLHISSEIPEEIIIKWGKSFESTPQTKAMQSKKQWQDLKNTTRNLISTGYIPPHGTRWLNFVQNTKQKVRNIFKK